MSARTQSGGTRPGTRRYSSEKRGQLDNLHAFQRRHADRAPAALRRLQGMARSGGNVFAELMETVKVASLGQITNALFEVGRQLPAFDVARHRNGRCAPPGLDAR